MSACFQHARGWGQQPDVLFMFNLLHLRPNTATHTGVHYTQYTIHTPVHYTPPYRGRGKQTIQRTDLRAGRLQLDVFLVQAVGVQVDIRNQNLERDVLSTG